MKPSGTNGTRAAKQQCSQMTDEMVACADPVQEK